jgi:hypothetical protein
MTKDELIIEVTTPTIIPINSQLPKSLPTYVCSFRAECPADVMQVMHDLWFLRERYDIKSLRVNSTVEYSVALEPWVEISSDTIPFEEIKKVILGVQDGHVMVQTLRPVPVNENSMERDRSINWDTGEKDNESLR